MLVNSYFDLVSNNVVSIVRPTAIVEVVSVESSRATLFGADSSFGGLNIVRACLLTSLSVIRGSVFN